MRISGAGTAPIGRRGWPAAFDLAPGRPVLGRASLRRGKEWRFCAPAEKEGQLFYMHRPAGLGDIYEEEEGRGLCVLQVPVGTPI